VPPRLRRAFERCAARAGGPDLETVERACSAADDWSALAVHMRELGRRSAEPLVGEALSQLFRCTLHPRAYLRWGGPDPGELYPPELPEVVEATSVAVRDAFFARALAPTDFAEGAPLKPFHMPGVLLRIGLALAVQAPVVEAWTAADGALSVGLLERWCSDVVDLAGLLDLELLPPFRHALPERFSYYFGGCAWGAVAVARPAS
jgi:hypothetical protein